MCKIFELTMWICFMLAASYTDIRHRVVPNWLNFCIAVCSLPGLQLENLAGILCSIPFLLAAICWGGIGGGDIKFMAACGMHLGLYGGLEVAVLGTVILLVYHVCNFAWCSLRKRQVPTSYPMVPFLTIASITVIFTGG